MELKFMRYNVKAVLIPYILLNKIQAVYTKNMRHNNQILFSLNLLSFSTRKDKKYNYKMTRPCYLWAATDSKIFQRREEG